MSAHSPMRSSAEKVGTTLLFALTCPHGARLAGDNVVWTKSHSLGRPGAREQGPWAPPGTASCKLRGSASKQARRQAAVNMNEPKLHTMWMDRSHPPLPVLQQRARPCPESQAQGLSLLFPPPLNIVSCSFLSSPII